jgi:uncharacterized protein
MVSRRHLLRASAGFAAIGLTGLSGCTSANPNYYRLGIVPGAVHTGGPGRIEVRSISIPGYLDRDGIVKGGGNYEIDIHDNDLWAEDFAGMLQDSMVQDLAQRLPNTTVTGPGSSITGSPDALVEINLQRFDTDASGMMIFIAQLAIKSGASLTTWATRTLRYSAPANGPRVAAVVAVMSHLWGEAADDAASLLVQSWAHHPRVAAD